MGGYAAGLRGQVRILASVSAMAESLADDVAAFLQLPAHANIQIDMEERVSPDIVRGVRDGAASLGVCWDACELGELHSRPYRSDHLCMVVPAGHPLARAKRVRFEQTLAYEHVSLPVNSAVQVMLQREAARLGRLLIHRVIVTNFEAALRVVRAGLAISLVPREVAEVYTVAYGLKIIPLSETWARRRFIICFKDAKTLSPSAQLLIDHLAAQHS
jgi:DNA-binding transcriptional LysR family regulator